MEKTSIEEQFETYRESLFRECEHLISTILLYKHIYERRNDRLRELNLAPCFFGYTLEAFHTTIIIWTEKLLSPKSKRGLFDFLAFIKNNIDLFSIRKLQERRNYPDDHRVLTNREPITYDAIQDDSDRLAGLGLDEIQIRRDKFQAHFDKKYFFNRKQLGADAPIKWELLTKITQVIPDIFNKYSTAYDGCSYSFEIININDIDHILNILHKQKNK